MQIPTNWTLMRMAENTVRNQNVTLSKLLDRGGMHVWRDGAADRRQNGGERLMTCFSKRKVKKVKRVAPFQNLSTNPMVNGNRGQWKQRRVLFQPVCTKLVVKIRATDIEDLGSSRTVAFRLAESFLYPDPFCLLSDSTDRSAEIRSRGIRRHL